MVCPNCGCENKEGVRFCKNCGKELGGRSTPSENNGGFPPNRSAFEHLGTYNPSKTAGGQNNFNQQPSRQDPPANGNQQQVNIQSSNSNSSVTPPKQPSKTGIFIALGAVIVVLIAVIVVLLVTKGNSDPSSVTPGSSTTTQKNQDNTDQEENNDTTSQNSDNENINYSRELRDEAGVLSDGEFLTVSDYLSDIAADLKDSAWKPVSIGILTKKSVTGSSIESVAADYYKKMVFSDVCALLVYAKDTNTVYLYTHDSEGSLFFGDTINQLKNTCFPMVTSGDYADAFCKFADLVLSYREYVIEHSNEAINRDYDFNDNPPEELYNIPDELSSYAMGLRPEGRTYKVSVAGQNRITIRTTPVYLLKDGKPSNNVYGFLNNGSRVYVEYIYNGIWAVYRYNGGYVFSSVYNMANPNSSRIMIPVE